MKEEVRDLIEDRIAMLTGEFLRFPLHPQKEIERIGRAETLALLNQMKWLKETLENAEMI